MDKQPRLAAKRWYPTVAFIHHDTSAQGKPLDRMLVLGTSLGQNNPDVNRYEFYEYDPTDPGTAASTTHTSGHNGPVVPGVSPNAYILRIYPRVHLLSTGFLFRAGMQRYPAWLDHLANPGSWVTGPPNPWNRFYGTSVLFPIIENLQEDRVYILGGQARDDDNQPVPYVSTNGFLATVRWMDAGAQNPTWTDAPSMTWARARFNSVLLPDGSLFVVGGHDTGALLQPEILRNGQWLVGPPMASERTYHSTAVLLADGRVLVGGGDSRSWDYQVYNPAYLCGLYPRPVVTVSPAPGEVQPGASFTMAYDPAVAPVTKAVLVRPGSVTHHADYEQRLVELGFSDQNGTLTLTLPANGFLVPPGYYMVFLLSDRGIPATASWIKVVWP